MNYLIDVKISLSANVVEEYEFISNFFPSLGLIILNKCRYYLAKEVQLGEKYCVWIGYCNATQRNS